MSVPTLETNRINTWNKKLEYKKLNKPSYIPKKDE